MVTLSRIIKVRQSMGERIIKFLIEINFLEIVIKLTLTLIGDNSNKLPGIHNNDI